MKKINSCTLIVVISLFIVSNCTDSDSLQILDASTCNKATVNLNQFSTKFIRLVAAPNQVQNLSQIVCIDNIGFNVLKNVKYTATSTASGLNPFVLTDGNKSLRTSPNIYVSSDTDKNNVITFELGASYNVNRCIIYNRLDCCKERIINSRVELLDENKNLLASTVVTTGEDIIKIYFSNQRFIKLNAIRDGSDNSLNLSQIACFDRAGNNITKGKKVLASSNSTTNDPNLITDGNLSLRDSASVFISNNAENDNVIIDLEATYDVNKCEVYNRKDCCKNKIIGASLFILDDTKSVLKSKLIETADDKISLVFSS